VLAAQADARWEAKPRVMEAPEDAAARIAPAGPVAAVGQEQQQKQQQKQQDAESEQQAARSEQQQPAEQETGSAAVKGKGAAASPAAAPENDPWAKARAQGPSEKWQPAAWTPTAAKKR